MSETRPVSEAQEAKQLTITWSPPPITGASTLAIVCAYRGGDGDARSWLGRAARLLRKPQVDGHRIVHRDFYANPRDPAYLAGLVLSIVHAVAPGSVHVVIDRRIADSFSLPVDWISGIERLDLGERSGLGQLRERAGAFENVVLVFPDALGLGCERIERAAVAGAKRAVNVVNGRRRAFTLDSVMRRGLRWRRIVALSRAPELLLSMLVWPVAIVCVLFDALSNSPPEEWHT